MHQKASKASWTSPQSQDTVNSHTESSLVTVVGKTILIPQLIKNKVAQQRRNLNISVQPGCQITT